MFRDEEETASGLAFLHPTPTSAPPLAFEAPFSFPYQSCPSFLGPFVSSELAAQAPGCACLSRGWRWGGGVLIEETLPALDRQGRLFWGRALEMGGSRATWHTQMKRRVLTGLLTWTDGRGVRWRCE